MRKVSDGIDKDIIDEPGCLTPVAIGLLGSIGIAYSLHMEPVYSTLYRVMFDARVKFNEILDENPNVDSDEGFEDGDR